MKKLYGFSLLALLLLSATAVAAPLNFSGKVVKIIDGDTIDVLHDGRPARVRLLGIDAPEKGQPFGKAARRHLAALAALKDVEVKAQTLDRYGRTVGEILLPGGLSLNRQMVEDGYAWHYTQYSKDPALAQSERAARSAKRGLWQEKNPEPPWEYRQRRTSLKKSSEDDLFGPLLDLSRFLF